MCALDFLFVFPILLATPSSFSVCWQPVVFCVHRGRGLKRIRRWILGVGGVLAVGCIDEGFHRCLEFWARNPSRNGWERLIQCDLTIQYGDDHHFIHQNMGMEPRNHAWLMIWMGCGDGSKPSKTVILHFQEDGHLAKPTILQWREGFVQFYIFELVRFKCAIGLWVCVFVNAPFWDYGICTKPFPRNVKRVWFGYVPRLVAHRCRWWSSRCGILA